MIRSRLASAAGCLALLPLSALGGEDWSQWRGPDRSGAAPQTPAVAEFRTEVPPDGLTPKWVAEVPGGFSGGWSSPVIADGRVYLAVAGRVKKEGVKLPPPQYPPLPEGEDDDLSDADLNEYEQKRRAESLERRQAEFTGREALHAFDSATGELLWTAERDTIVTRFPQSSTPAVVGERIVLLSGDRVLRALDAKTGDVLWETTLPGEVDGEQISSSPLVVADANGAGGAVYVQADGLFRVSLADGSLAWRNDEIGGRDSSPAFWRNDDGGAVIVNAKGGETVAVNAADGKELWALEDTGAERSSPVVVPGTGAAGTGAPGTSGAADRLLTFGSSRKGGLRCYALAGEAPELLWKYQKLSDPGASPVVAGGLVLAPGDQRLDCVQLEDGEPCWTTRLDLDRPRYTSPAALAARDGENGAGGLGLYTYGRLLAFDLTADDFRPRFDLSVGPEGLAKTEDQWRQDLDIPAGTPEGVARFDREITRVGLLDCASPALADGRVFVRLKKALACYDLTK